MVCVGVPGGGNFADTRQKNPKGALSRLVWFCLFRVFFFARFVWKMGPIHCSTKRLRKIAHFVATICSVILGPPKKKAIFRWSVWKRFARFACGIIRIFRVHGSRMESWTSQTGWFGDMWGMSPETTAKQVWNYLGKSFLCAKFRLWEDFAGDNFQRLSAWPSQTQALTLLVLQFSQFLFCPLGSFLFSFWKFGGLRAPPFLTFPLFRFRIVFVWGVQKVAIHLKKLFSWNFVVSVLLSFGNGIAFCGALFLIGVWFLAFLALAAKLLFVGGWHSPYKGLAPHPRNRNHRTSRHPSTHTHTYTHTEIERWRKRAANKLRDTPKERLRVT